MKQTGKEYPEYIMEALRQREGLDEKDTSQDAELQQMSPDTAFYEVCQWHGLVGYDCIIKGWIESIYGIKLFDTED